MGIAEQPKLHQRMVQYFNRHGVSIDLAEDSVTTKWVARRPVAICCGYLHTPKKPKGLHFESSSYERCAVCNGILFFENMPIPHYDSLKYRYKSTNSSSYQKELSLHAERVALKQKERAEREELQRKQSEEARRQFYERERLQTLRERGMREADERRQREALIKIHQKERAEREEKRKQAIVDRLFNEAWGLPNNDTDDDEPVCTDPREPLEYLLTKEEKERMGLK